jgi:hypothetical protein
MKVSRLSGTGIRNAQSQKAPAAKLAKAPNIPTMMSSLMFGHPHSSAYGPCRPNVDVAHDNLNLIRHCPAIEDVIVQVQELADQGVIRFLG